MTFALQPTHVFSLASHAGPYEQWPLTTPLLVNGVRTDRTVPGYVIEGQYQWHDHALLILSYDCPFEESYEFVLLNRTHDIVVRTSLGAPYATYLLHAHWPIDDTSLRLHFYTTSCYTLRVIPPGTWRRSFRLALRHHLRTPQDVRTQASIAELRAALASVAAR